jgi:hypothetical protein
LDTYINIIDLPGFLIIRTITGILSSIFNQGSPKEYYALNQKTRRAIGLKHVQFQLLSHIQYTDLFLDRLDMHFIKNILLLVTCVTTVFSVAIPETNDADLECKDLGGKMKVLDIDLPVGVTQADVRKCEGHPLAHNFNSGGDSSEAPVNVNENQNSTQVQTRSSLEESAAQRCYKKAPYGCDGGYCWKSCGDKNKGEWCWTANKGGYGAWTTCSNWQDCGTTTYACGAGCVTSRSCGCSC